MGRLEQHDRRPRLRRRGWLQPRGQDPARRPAVRGRADGQSADGERGDEHDRPPAPGAERRGLRRGQHRGSRHDDATAHRPEHAPRLVERHRRRAGGSVPLGARVHPGLRASSGQVDDSERADHRPDPRRRRLAADDLPVRARRRAHVGPRARTRRRQRDDHGLQPRSVLRRLRPLRDRSGHGPLLPVGRGSRRDPRLPDQLRARRRPRPRLRLHSLRDHRRRDPALVAGPERPVDPRRHPRTERRYAARIDPTRLRRPRRARRDRLRARLVRDRERRGAGVRLPTCAGVGHAGPGLVRHARRRSGYVDRDRRGHEPVPGHADRTGAVPAQRLAPRVAGGARRGRPGAADDEQPARRNQSPDGRVPRRRRLRDRREQHRWIIGRRESPSSSPGCTG